ncbi:neurogenic locus notch homolog protein 1-like, partial [Mizuhopecten yessoensis]|uniref:neurogenic locus notch homolog protein 1-like n=1 Tax=Mizuhopecten yessoensis TaxID=6573 RepID=UPI000B45E988
PCDLSPCLNGGTCSASSGSTFTCSCVSGFTGDTCETNAPCDLSPCLNGGTCSASSGSTFTCSCVSGFTGDTCETNAPCDLSPCLNGGTCSASSGSTFTCSCVSGFTGDTCETIVVTDTLVCGFETGEMDCPFTNAANDDYEWEDEEGSINNGPIGAQEGTGFISLASDGTRSFGYAMLTAELET